jgi:hypothetical protein
MAPFHSSHPSFLELISFFHLHFLHSSIFKHGLHVPLEDRGQQKIGGPAFLGRIPWPCHTNDSEKIRWIARCHGSFSFQPSIIFGNVFFLSFRFFPTHRDENVLNVQRVAGAPCAVSLSVADPRRLAEQKQLDFK